MFNTRDLSNLILICVASTIYSIFVRQTAFLFTGIPGSNYLLSIGHYILLSLALLLYGGKRWLITLQGFVIVLLTVPVLSVGGALNPMSSIPIMIGSLQLDLLSVSFYGYFNRRNQLKLWAIIMTTEYAIFSSLLRIIDYYFVSNPEVLTTYISVIQIMLPIIIIESVVGAYIGYQIFQRVKMTRLVNEKTRQKVNAHKTFL